MYLQICETRYKTIDAIVVLFIITQVIKPPNNSERDANLLERVHRHLAMPVAQLMAGGVGG
jgi:hypothetical protein